MWKRGKTVSSSKLDSSDREEEEEEEEEERGGTSHLSLRAFNKLSLSPLLFRHSGPRKRKRGKSLFLPLPASWLSTLKEASWGLHRSGGDNGRREEGEKFLFHSPLLPSEASKVGWTWWKVRNVSLLWLLAGGEESLSLDPMVVVQRGGGRHRLSVAGD